MAKTKKARDINNKIDPKLQKHIKNQSPEIRRHSEGVAGDKLVEGVPQFLKAPSEKVIQTSNNAFIVLGRDRPQERTSGYGGKAHSHAGAIDIVVGRMGFRAAQVNERGEPLATDPDFFGDAARIYISQKSDVDEYFKLPDGKVGNFKTRSAIAMKADAVRVIGREGIKLVTGVHPDGEKTNSQGGELNVRGIDLIAGNGKRRLQPIPLGGNLRECLERIVQHIDKLDGILTTVIKAQFDFNEQLATHFHYSPFFGMPTTLSPPVYASGFWTNFSLMNNGISSLIGHKGNLSGFKMTYLTPAGSKYINSRNNNTN